MPIQDLKVDGYTSLSGGMNEGVAPSVISSSQTQRNVNLSLRRGVLSPRGRLVEVELDFSNAQGLVPGGSLSYQENYLKGRRQHAGKYQNEFGEYAIEVINGVIYLWNTQTCQVCIVEVDGVQPTANQRCVRLNGGQAFDYYVLYDWPNSPIVIKNFEARRALFENEEIPRSYIGAFVHNRLFVGNAGIEFGGSDPVSPSNPDAPITFLESIVSNDNPSPAFPDQFFSLSYIEKLSNITAMGFLQKVDATSAIGYGPLFVSTKEAIHVFPVSNPRDTWSQGQFGRVLIFNYGVVGDKAHVNVGGDLFYRSWDGHVYSTQTLLSDQKRWGERHLSREIECSLVTRNRSLLQYSAMGYYDNRIYTTLQPSIKRALDRSGNCIQDVVFNGLGVMELNNVSGLTANDNPIWATIIPGRFQCMEEIDNEYYIFGKNCDSSRNVTYKLDDFRDCDFIGGVNKPIKSRIYTKELVWDQPFLDKKVERFWIDIREIVGDLKVDISYRTCSECEWKHFGQICCEADCCDGYTSNRRCLSDEIVCHNSEESATFKHIQFKIDIEGYYFEVVKILAFADLCTELVFEREFDAEFESNSHLSDRELCL